MAPVLSSVIPENNAKSTPKYRPPSPIGDDTHRDIAIIGFSFQFPQADSTESFWELLISGSCASSEFPPSRFHNIALHESGNDGTANIRPKKASFLERDISAFDTRFFGMTSEEAVATDPQQRILLETTYRALENAGIPMESIKGSNTSVYTGCFTADYTMNAARDPDSLPKYSATGLAGSLLSNRISTFFDLTGPSITVDTACSSSLVALDLACQSLMSGQSDMGIVIGSNLLLTKDLFISLSNLGFLSPDGVCHSFDSRANGYGRGEGFGALIVKPVEAAIRDGDTIRAVIRAIGTNQNGKTNLAQPDKQMQRELIENTYRKANIDKSQTRFFEAHGTGTVSGDPLEAGAIGDVFRPGRDPSDPLIVGSVKSNIGHLEGAAGIAGLIKTILVLENGIIPPVAGLDELNENIDADFLHLKFPKVPIPWPGSGLRRASINSFGFGGTNAHVVLDDAFHYLEARGLAGRYYAPSQLLDKPTIGPHQGNDDTSHSRPLLFVWSAGDQEATSRMIRGYQKYLEKGLINNEVRQDDLVALAHTLTQRRTRHSWRTFTVAASIPHLIRQLTVIQTPIVSSPKRNAAFIFTGQGAQWVGMGKELLSYSVFRDSIFEADRFLQTIGCFWMASSLLEGHETRLNIHEPRFAQPLCTILQVAVVELLRSFGIHPAISIGHSSGEIAAAYTTGAICRQSAWKLAYFRGLLSSELAESSQGRFRGSMMAVGAHEASLRPYLDEALSTTQGGVLAIACFNSDRSLTVAGDELLVQTLRTKLEKDGVFTRVLNVPVAYHSSHMVAIASDYRKLIGTLEKGEDPSRYCHMISSVTGDNISATELRKPEYWVTNMVSPVRFSQAIERLYRNSAKNATKKIDMSHRNYIRVSDIVEIGPHSVLRGAVLGIHKTTAASNQISYSSSLIRGRPADTTLLELIGNLHCRGFDIDLGLVNNSLDELKRVPRTLATLPEYPYDHSRSYWSESRIAKNSRICPYPYSEFIGHPVADWNPLEPRWRNTLRVSSIPWLKDHQINNEILYPAAGMLVMAIEGMTQVMENRTIVGYELKDVRFFSALVIPQNDSGVEVQFHLKLSQDATEMASSSASFSLFLCKENFTEICRGSIKTDISAPNPSKNPVDALQVKYVHELIEEARSYCGIEMHCRDFYADLRKDGYQYGLSFQGVKWLFRNDYNQAVANVSMQSPKIDSPSKKFSALHPCTLDSIFQLCVSKSTQKRGSDKAEVWIPTFLASLRISNVGCGSATQSDEVEVYMNRCAMSSRRKVFSIHAMSEDTKTWILEAEGVETTSITDSIQELATNQPSVKKLCHDLLYKPDLDPVGPSLIIQYLQDYTRSNPQTTEFFRTLKLFILTSLSRAVDAIAIPTSQTFETHLQKQYSWMRKQISSTKQQSSLQIPSDWMKYMNEPLLNNLRDRLKTHTSRLGDIYVDFDTHMTRILQGKTEASQVLNQNNIIDEYYRLLADDSNFHHPLIRYIDTLAHKNPAMRILQVGAGIVSISKFVLSQLRLQTSDGPFCRFSRYDITDSLGSTLEAVSEVVGTLPKTQFRLFNFEEKPTNQGFEENFYDLVIVVNVPDTTEPLIASLGNFRKLLRDGGKLLIVDFTIPDSIIGRSILGCFPGWWHGEEVLQQGGSNVVETRWSPELKKSGFTGVDFAFNDFNIEGNKLSTVFVSSNIGSSVESREANLTKEKTVLIISSFDNPSGSALTKQVYSKLRAMGITDITESSFRGVAAQEDARSKLIIVVQDRRWLLLESLSTEEYALFHTTVNRCKYIMWISEIIPSSQDVSLINTVQGLARTLRMENHNHIFATVGIDTSRTAVVEQNLENAFSNYLRGVDSGSYEPELVQVGDMFHIPRVYENDSLNQKVHVTSSVSFGKPGCLGPYDTKLKVRQHGLLDTLYFEEVPDAGQLANDEIEVQIKAIGVNFKDCLVALGRIPDDNLGCECAGVVIKAGSSCQLRPGDHVVACALDSFRTRLRCKEELAVKIPGGMTMRNASSLGINFVTAYHSLVVVARLSEGESVLIHSGAGGTGQAAIQIAKYCGAQVFTTVGSPEKRELLNMLYDIPTDNILNSRDLSFASEIKRLTRGKGVDVVLNSLAGDALVASWECVASFGRFIEIGKRDIVSHNKLPMYQFAQNISFSAVDVAAIIAEKPRLIQNALVAISDLFNRDILRLVSPIKSFPISQVEPAFRYLQSGSNSGKVVVEINPDDIVPEIVRHKPGWEFNEKETFVIAGGLGGQGRSISKWMVSKGVRNLVLLSRTGLKDDRSRSFVRNLEQKGATVYIPKCDITSPESLREVLNYCSHNMPPIKGCIQAAMDIRDSMFENMSYESWIASTKPKVLGSWNLHQQLPRDLDFFILFSSISGIIGSQGQSNYATGNTFQDGLAQYRLSRGEKAVSLDLGILTSDGYIAENKEMLLRFMNIKQMLPIDEAEVLALLEVFCNKSLPIDPTRSQVVLGLELPANVINRGIEPSKWMYEPMFANLHQVTTSNTNSKIERTSGPTLVDQLATSKSLGEATDILANSLATRLGAIFSLPRDNFDLNQPLHTYGVDSLIAVELRNWFLKVLKVDLAIFEILGGATAMTLGKAAAEKMRS
ncbi:putative polyketide synthase [Annulohypoxylon truncatum]|uniref:putative polyketide synthase n=1 Tax=Annulohypoxylon truncatum TaxID=327061 RepID=UPI002008986E|nr:putative polyketide synthase [Annulohypoxylon truncatum]KAI1205339.1 putative polyketide synthase [Annulohypoxylon truncatum]